jgi:hypothetical protein
LAEIGKIERPLAESFAGKRKLYCVPNVYPFEGGPEDYQELVHRFWEEVSSQLERIEAAGKIGKIFCELLSRVGEDALSALAEVNGSALAVVKRKIEEGAVLIRTEDEEILGPFLDWRNCLNVVRTKEVLNKVLEFYSELSDRRLRFIEEMIGTSLSDGEAGLLIMRDEDRMKLRLPEDVEIFLVVPPAYDDIMRWFREKMKENERTDSGQNG